MARQPRLYQVRVDIYEASSKRPWPILTHLFNGATREEAWRYHEAHRKSDTFLKECEDKGLFDGRVKCRAQVSEGWR